MTSNDVSSYAPGKPLGKNAAPNYGGGISLNQRCVLLEQILRQALLACGSADLGAGRRAVAHSPHALLAHCDASA